MGSYAHVTVITDRDANAHADTDVGVAARDERTRCQEQYKQGLSDSVLHCDLSYIGTFCSTSTAPTGSVTTAIVPSLRSGEGGNSTVPPSSLAFAAAAFGSLTPK
jgi:hypothetical protein